MLAKSQATQTIGPWQQLPGNATIQGIINVFLVHNSNTFIVLWNIIQILTNFM